MGSTSFVSSGQLLTVGGVLFCAGLLLGAAVCSLIWRLRFRPLVPEGNPGLVFDHIPAMVAVYDPQGRLIYRNRLVVEYVGARPTQPEEQAESPGWELAEVVHPECREAVANEWLQCLKTGDPMVTTCRVRRWDGVYRWFERRAQPRRNEQNQIVCWYVLYFDIHDRKTAEDGLIASEQNLRLMIEAIPALVVRAAPAGDVDYANQRVLDFVGSSFEDFINLTWAAYLYPDDVDETRRRWHKALETGTPVDTQFRLRRADGVYRWFAGRGNPLCDPQGTVLSWYTIILDIDDFKKAEEALVDSERSLRLIIEAIPAFVWRTSAAGENDYSNLRLLDYTGGSLEDYSGSRWVRNIHPDDVEETRRVFQRALDTGIPYRTFFRLRRMDGVYRWFDVRGDPLRSPDGEILSWYGLLFDVDDSRRMSEELRQTRSKLSRAMQLATVAELSASIAHEINQPLAAVVANGEACQTWLSRNPSNIERARLTAERIVRDGKSAAQVVSRIRRLFKQSAPAKTTLDLNDVIREVIELTWDELSKHSISTETQLDSALPSVMADRVQMQQVLTNLMSNAVESMEGTLGYSKVLSIRSGRDDETGIRIEVQDRGVGIADPESIFDPLFTTKENGMGMGLSICRTIVQAHGGKLWAARNHDIGTTMVFTLPLLEETEQ